MIPRHTRPSRGCDEPDYFQGTVIQGDVHSSEDLRLTEEEAEERRQALARKRPMGFTAKWDD